MYSRRRRRSKSPCEPDSVARPRIGRTDADRDMPAATGVRLARLSRKSGDRAAIVSCNGVLSRRWLFERIAQRVFLPHTRHADHTNTTRRYDRRRRHDHDDAAYFASRQNSIRPGRIAVQSPEIIQGPQRQRTGPTHLTARCTRFRHSHAQRCEASEASRERKSPRAP
jgi:hypothetical protein